MKTFTRLLWIALLGILSQASWAQSVSFNDAEMTLGNSKTLANSSISCNQNQVDRAELFVVFKMGQTDYEYGINPFNSQVTVQLTGNTGGTAVNFNPVTVDIDQTKPEMWVRVDYTSNWGSINSFTVTPTGYVGPAIGLQDIQLEVKTKLEYRINVSNESVTLNAINIAGNPAQFTWSPSCTQIPAYELQVLRLFNTENSGTYLTNTKKVKTTVNWDYALSVLVEDGDSTLSLPITEGTGLYLWRVRPIGTLNGGFKHSKDWGGWSTTNGQAAPESGQLADLEYNGSGTLPGYAFYYEQFDDDKNWGHVRGYSEGTRITESMVYADHLGRMRQNQSYVQSEQDVLVNQVLPDLSGRPGLSSMTAPSGQNHFGYVEKMLQDNNGNLYVAEDFDSDGNYENPLKVFDGPIQDYYSDDNPDLTIPSAEGYPYTRVTYSKDGSGRPREIGSPGSTHRIKNVVGQADRTTKTLYSDVADLELIRIFSDEAPAANTVIKRIYIDPNKTTTVSYIDKVGHTIATCLSVSADTSPVVALPSEANASFYVEDTIRNSKQIKEGVWSSTKKLSFTKDEFVALYYDITPENIESACANFCTTCDYVVDLMIHDLDNPDSPFVETTVIEPGTCNGGTKYAILTADLKANKTYVLERRIRMGTLVPGSKTSQNPLGITYLQAHLDSIRGKLEERYEESMDSLFDYLDNANVEGFYHYLNTEMTYDSITGILEVDSCFSVKVPREKCNEDACAEGTPSFEQFLFDSWPVYAGSNPDLDDFFRTNGNGTFAPLSCAQGCFDDLIQNMVADGYDCNALWNCWVPIVRSFGEIAFITEPIYAFNQDFDMLETFLSCADGIQGRQFEGISSIPDGPTGYLSNAHKYFQYTQGDEPECEQLFGLNAGNFTAITTGWAAAQWEEFYNCVSGRRKYSSIKSLKTYTNPNNATLDSLRESGEDFCRGLCYEKRYAFLTALVDEYKEKEYLLNADQTWLVKTDKSDSLPLSDLECVADNIVSYCQNHCDQMMIYQIFPNDSILQSMGSVQLPEIEKAFGKAFEIELPDPNTGLCDTTFARITSGYPVGGKYVDYDLLANMYEWISVWMKYHQDSSLTGGGQADPFRFPSDIFSNNYGYVNLLLETDPRVIYSDTVSLFHNYKTWHLTVHDCKLYLKGWGTINFADSFLLIENVCKWQPINCGQEEVLDAMNKRLEELKASHSTVFNIPLDIPPGVSLPCSSQAMTLDIEHTFGVNYFRLLPGGMLVYAKQESDQSEPIYTYLCKLGCQCDPFTLLDSLQKFQFNVMVFMEQNMLDTMTVSVPGDFPTYGMPPDLLSCLPPSGAMGLQFRRDSTAQNYFNLEPDGSLVFYQFWNDSIYVQDTLCTEVCDVNTCDPVCFKWVEFAPIDPVTITPITCEERLSAHLKNLIDNQFAKHTERLLDAFKLEYKENCGEPVDLFRAGYELGLHHYTLYYYDRAGHLVRTVAPKDVNTTATTRGSHVSHVKQSEYVYNSIGLVLQKYSPDEGVTEYLYNYNGRMRFAQSAQQKLDNQYSYTKYDHLGRIIEMGMSGEDINTFRDSADQPNFPSSGIERVFYVYTYPSNTNYIDGTAQNGIQNRISYAYKDRDGDLNTPDQVITTYSYDIHGNIEWKVEEVAGLGKNYIRFEYDLISGDMIKLYYNEQTPEQFIHRYNYDADGRLILVETSTDEINWDRDANMEFYTHGKLKRTKLGEDQIQGLDYTFTLSGDLKGINHSKLDVNIDPGQDGKSGSGNAAVAPDVFGMIVGYYTGDFKRSYSGANSAFNSSGTGAHIMGTDFFNGNISTLVYQSDSINGLQYQRQNAYKYQYDQMNRLVEGDFWTDSRVTPGNWTDALDYDLKYAYDANGNLKTLERDAYDGTALDPQAIREMDRFDYQYYPGTNRLEYIHDMAAAGNSWDDIEFQTNGNYEYDASGKLISDSIQGLTIQWTANGKVKEIHKFLPGQSIDYKIYFLYNAAGNRVQKTVEDFINNTLKTTYYVHSDQGVLLSTYSRPSISSPIMLSKQYMYGLSRLGAFSRDEVRNTTLLASIDTSRRRIGRKNYQINDHLGNVRVVVSDLKSSTLTGGVPGNFIANIQDKSDYYAFGMKMPGSNANIGSYLFGFNGQEQDNEIAGAGNSLSAEYWQYDPRVGRRWNLDPMLVPYESQYSTFHNNPIRYADPLGLYGSERRAERARKRAVRKYGEEYVSDKVTKDSNGEWFYSLYSKGQSKNGVEVEQGENETEVVIIAERPHGKIYNHRDLVKFHDKHGKDFNNGDVNEITLIGGDFDGKDPAEIGGTKTYGFGLRTENTLVQYYDDKDAIEAYKEWVRNYQEAGGTVGNIGTAIGGVSSYRSIIGSGATEFYKGGTLKAFSKGVIKKGGSVVRNPMVFFGTAMILYSNYNEALGDRLIAIVDEYYKLHHPDENGEAIPAQGMIIIEVTSMGAPLRGRIPPTTTMYHFYDVYTGQHLGTTAGL